MLVAKPFCDPDSHAADPEGQAGPIMATLYERGVIPRDKLLVQKECKAAIMLHDIVEPRE